MNPLEQLRANGQSIWLDSLRLGMLSDGTFERMVRDWAITGVTSNPSIFATALRSGDYDDDIAARVGRTEPMELFHDLALRDIRVAADVLAPVWRETGGTDGFASFELDPSLADDAPASIRAARELFRRIDRPNAMIKVPGTDAGIAAARELTSEGLNVNITLLFSVRAYERFAEAYIEGLESRLAAGKALGGVASVASFFVSRIDAVVDRALPAGSTVQGRAAVANARHAYRRYLQIFSGPRWDVLRVAGARPQRVLWASVGTKDPAYSDVKYVEELIAPGTVATVPEATLHSFLDHGDATPADMQDFDGDLRALHRAGVDLDRIGAELLRAGLETFEADMTTLLQRLDGAEGTDARSADRVRSVRTR
jgi:transaldolase